MNEKTYTRIRPTFTNEEVISYRHCTLSGSPVLTHNSEFYSVDEMKDNVNPDFAIRSSLGDIVMSDVIHRKTNFSTSNDPYYRATLKSNPDSGYKNCGDGSLTMYHAGVYGGVDVYETRNFDPDFIAREIEASQSRCLSRVDSTPYAFGEDALELAQTIAFLKNPVGRTLKNLDKFENWVRYRFFDDATLTLGQVLAETWLTYRFAYQPLLFSITDAIEIYQRGLSKKLRRFRRARDTRKFSNPSSQQVNTGPTNNLLHFHQEFAANLKIVSTIFYEDKSPLRSSLEQLGFGTKDIVPTLWAVVPLSFLFDRLYDVSTFIKGAQNLLDPSIEILGACVSTKEQYTCTTQNTGQTHPSYNITAIGDTVTYNEDIYDRFDYSPSYAFSLPNLTPENLVNDLTSIADSLALAGAVWDRLKSLKR